MQFARERIKHNGWGRIFTMLVVCLCLFLSPHFTAAQNELGNIRRSQRALFIFNFTNYFDWRDQDQLEIFSIGVLGDDPIIKNLQTMAVSRTVKGKIVAIKEFTDVSKISDVQLLYVNSRYNYDINEVLDQIRSKNILLVSENYKFNQSMINIIDMEDLIQFELNESIIRKEGFRVPQSLSELAVTSADVWHELYRQAEISLNTEREKVAQQQAELDQLAQRIQEQQESINHQRSELEEQQNLLEYQKDTIKVQTGQISAKLQEIDSLQSEYDNKLLLLKGLEGVITEQMNQMSEQEKEIALQNLNIGKQDSILENQKDYIVDQESKITEQESAINQQQLALAYQRKFTYLFVALFGLVLITSFFIYRGYRFKLKSNEALAAKNVEIEHQAKELEERNKEIEGFVSIIKKEEANLKSLLENTTDIIWSLDKRLRFITFNEAFRDIHLRLINKKPKLKAKFRFNLLPETIATFWQELYERALTGERFVAESMMDINDESITYELFFNPIFEEDEVIGVSVFGRDITSRIIEQRNKEKFQEGLKLLNYLASQSEIGFEALTKKALKLVKDLLQMPFGAICMVEDDYEYRLIQYQSQKRTINTDKAYALKDSLVELIFKNEKILHMDKVQDQEEKLLTSFGTKIESFIGAVIYLDGKKYGVVYFADILPKLESFDSYDKEFLQLFANWIGSEISRKESQKLLMEAKENAEAASKAKANFLSTISHEIRTPLNGIIGTSYLLLNKDPRPNQLEYIKMLKNSGENLLSIVNDVLDYNKIEQGKLELDVIDMNLREIMEGITHTTSIAATDKGLDLTLEYDKELKDYYGGDPTRISQVLNNLVTNAIKFTSEGSVRIKVSKKEQMGGGDRILFEVIDTGIGIKPEIQSKIFEEFTQADTSTSREFGGSGLGLSICQNLLKLMKSKIALSSELGRGSNFNFELSLPYSDPQAVEDHKEGVFGEGRDLSGLKILLVEDNKYNRVIAEDFLTTWGADVETAIDGGEAIETIQGKDFDLILMDLQMPNVDGYEATTTIRSFNDPYFRNIPILALSASSLNRVKAKAMSVGMNGFITKPFKPEEFFSKVKEHFHLKDKTIESNDSGGSLDYLQKATNGSSELMIKYLNIFVESMEESVVALDASIKAKDAGQISAISHKVKSGLRSVGFNDLGNRAEFFEETLESGADIGDLLPEVENYLVDLVKAIDSVREMKQQAAES